MKFGEEEEFTFPQPDGSFWTPGIQQEPVMLGGSNPSNNDSIQEENQRENINWAELVGIYSDFLQEKEKCADVQSNPVVQTPRSIVYPTSRILNPTSYSQIQNNWTELHPMLMHTRQASNQQQMSSYAFPIPYHSPSFATPPQTPDHGRLLRNQQLLAMGGSLFYQEKQQQENASSYVQEMQTQSCNQLLDSVVASSSFSPSSSLKTSLNKDNYISEDGANGGIDLNKTPKQNTPKRKKHRPKVVVEGKPKRTPRPTTPSNTQNRTSSSSSSSSSGKRKYVRKSGLGDDSISQSIEKSCRRMLNFEFEVAAQVQGNDQQTTPSMGLNRRDAEQEQQQLNDKFPSLSTSMAPRDHHTLNVIARNINLKNATTHQNQLGCNKVVHQQIHGEVMAQMPLHPNNETDQVMLQTRIESINSVLPEPNEKRGCKRDYSSITKLTPSPTNLMPLNESRKSKIQGKRHHRAAATSIMTSCNTNVKKSSRQVQYKGSTPYNNGSPQSSDLEEKNWPQGQASVASGSPNYQYKDPTVVGNNIHGQRYSSQVKMQRNCMAGQILKEYTESHRASLLTQQNMPSPLQRRILNTTRANETETPKPVKRQMVEHNSSAMPLNKEAKVLKDLKKETGNVLSSRKATGKNEKWDHEMKIKEITPQLKQMQITHNGQTEVGGEKETALEGDEMTNVPCEVDPIRRRKPRLKVDLDPDAKKLWLVGKHGSESKETMNKEEEYWKKEREVFHGRVNRFISLLSLFQGNRQFSSWKGSVVDSVIGVFLTQNVADHLSSSAFMSLAAEFPPPRTLNLAREREEQEGQIIDPDGTITYHGRTLRQTLYNHNTGTSSQPSEKRSVHVINEAQIHLVKENKHQEGFSSQISSESSVLQANGDVQSSSDSEVENQVTLCSSIMCQSFKNTLQTGRAASIQQHHSHETRSPSLDNMPAPECQKQPSPVCNRHNSTSNIGNDAYGSPINSKNLFSEGSFVQKQNACMSPSVGPSGNETTKIPKPRKKKLNEKTNSFDWESLRAQAVLKAEKQKRSKDRMDLLNYEALRQADVKKIAGIIKERGMNNMLAKRIKDFLNRLVRDHGSIDLEWLRDIPPDKAKEYLLSIPGLGLKSVECVRLLTLHHIAFPVDINVARIVVRLGWVPLQPLPEPLSFHQLELYPTLESVQKYLWPRLCKLDHKTLYELHYQMITFGKVFCTKLLPNCNGCPMKKECRHFANASASARPALPGPEERSIVSSTTPVAPNGSPPAVLKPVPLSLSETNKVSGSQYIISSQQAPIAIVELPEAASDIEDTVYQDTNEIPNTNFHLEGLDMFELDLTKERNEGLSEAALSQALVALNPQDVSIPAPKLKNENRLRTEHQVYEIPDSHPILEGMDKRDPGDTTPYLLAIWMPGETENSTQPPKSICNFQGTGKLCNDETCFQCNSVKETNSQIVRGTLLIPYLTATRGAFPLNGTYFQINEVFADHESSHNPINVPRDWLWKLERRTVYFGTSVSAIARGFSSTEVQNCFWRGSVCVRAFDRETRSPKSLVPRLHCSPGKKLNNKNRDKEKQK